MGKKSFKNKHDQQWEWEETPEVAEALKKLHAKSQSKSNPKSSK